LQTFLAPYSTSISKFSISTLFYYFYLFTNVSAWGQVVGITNVRSSRRLQSNMTTVRYVRPTVAFGTPGPVVVLNITANHGPVYRREVARLLTAPAVSSEERRGLHVLGSQVRRSARSVYPSWQTHWYEPCELTHSCSQPPWLSRHSSTSATTVTDKFHHASWFGACLELVWSWFVPNPITL